MRNSKIIAAYLRLYTEAQIRAALASALADHASGVTVTTQSIDGASTAAATSTSVVDRIETLEACLSAIENNRTSAPTRSAMVISDFSRCRY